MIDLILYNAFIYTMESPSSIYYAIAIRDGKVVQLYNKEDFVLESISAISIIDMQGQTILPGLVDSHLHFLSYIGMCVFGCQVHKPQGDILVPESIDDILELIQVECQTSTMSALLFHNYCPSATNCKRLPTKQELDRISKDKAIVVMTIDGHSSSLNSKALSIIGLHSDTGILEGLEHESNQGKIIGMMKKSMGVKQLARGLAIGVQQALSYGITTLVTLEGYDEVENDIVFELFIRLLGALPVNVRLFPQFKDIDRVLKYQNRMRSLRIGGCGVWELDGAVGSHSAAFYDSYKDRQDTRGELYYSNEELLNQCIKADNKGAQISMHAIGERACEQAVKIYKNLESSCLLHRIEHFEFPTRQAVEDVKKLNVSIAPQPGYNYYDYKYVKSYETFLQDKYLDQQIPLRELFEAGINIIGSSDAPVQDINPYIQLHGMTNFPIASQSLSTYQAFSTYTINAGKALGENDIGNLKIGSVADLVVYKKNPMLTTDLLEVKPTLVYKSGKIPIPLKGTVLELIGMLLKKKNLI